VTTEQLRYLVTADTAQLKKLEAQTAAYNKQMGEGTAASAARGKQAFSSMASRAGLWALGIGAVGAMAVKSAASYDKAMNVFQATSGATAKEMKAARKAAIDLGNDAKLPGVAATDAANAMNELAKGGFTARQSIKATRGVLLLGQAAGMDYADAATIVARSLKSFHMPASKATSVVNTLAAAALKSTVGVQDIADGMSYAGQSARTLGVSFKDTSSALAILNDAGVQGSKAGTSLQQMFVRLSPTTKKAKDEMQKLGLITKEGNNRFFDAKGRFIGMKAATEVYGKAVSKLTPQQRLMSQNIIFGSNAAKAAGVILGGGEKQWTKYSKAIGKGGMAQKLASAQAKGMAGVIEQAKNAIQTLSIVLGTALIPAFQSVLKPITRVITWLSKYPGLLKWLIFLFGGLAAAIWGISKAVNATRTIMDMAAYLKTLAKSEMVAAFASKVWAAAQWLLNAAMEANPILLIVTALVALGVALVIAYKKSETFRNIVQAAFKAVSDAASWLVDFVKGAWDTLVSAFQTVMDWLSSNWPLVATLISGPFAPLVALATDAFGIRTALTDAFSAVIGWVKDNWQLIATLLSGPFAPLVALATDAFGIRTALTDAFSAVLAWMKSNWQAIATIISGPFAPIVALATDAFGVRTALVGAFQACIDWLKANWKEIATVLTLPFTPLVALATDGFGIRTKLLAAFGSVLTYLKGAWTAVAGWIKKPFTDLLAGANNLWGLVPALVSAFKAVKDWIARNWPIVATLISGPFAPLVAVAANAFGIREKLVSALAKTRDAVAGKGKEIAAGLWNAILNGLRALDSFAWQVKNRIVGGITDASSWLVAKGGNVIDGMIAGIKNSWRALENMAANVKGHVTGAVQNAASWLYDRGKNVVAGIVNGIHDGWRSLEQMAGNIRDHVVGGVKNAARWLYDAGRDIVQGLINGLGSKMSSLFGKVKSMANKVKSLPGKIWHALSPSRVFRDYGQDLMVGLTQGIDRHAAAAIAASGKAAQQVSEAATVVPSVAAMPAPRATPTVAATPGAAAAAPGAAAPLVHIDNVYATEPDDARRVAAKLSAGLAARAA
jgi:TP901 family phage tail tape measure protein